jgi:hypothetical protein
MKRTSSLAAVQTFGSLLLAGLLTSCAAHKEPSASPPVVAPATGTPPPATTAAEKPTPQPAKTAVSEVAGELVVSLDSRDPSAGESTWKNQGSMGDFNRIGTPKLSKFGGQPAVEFNGASDAYRSANTVPASLSGAHARSIEVWVCNPSFESTEECMVAWGERGTALANMAFNYGSGGGFSAVTHYDQDMGWGDESPTVNEWHYLVYTYDGKTARIYDNALERDSQDFALVTAGGTHMNIAVENSAQGEPIFQSEFDNPWPLAFSGFIATVRVHSGALTPVQIKANLNAEKDRFSVKTQ